MILYFVLLHFVKLYHMILCSYFVRLGCLRWSWIPHILFGSFFPIFVHMGVSISGGTPRSSICIGLSTINCPLKGTRICGHPHIFLWQLSPYLSSPGASTTSTFFTTVALHQGRYIHSAFVGFWGSSTAPKGGNDGDDKPTYGDAFELREKYTGIILYEIHHQRCWDM